jgi:hypothetical protein
MKLPSIVAFAFMALTSPSPSLIHARLTAEALPSRVCEADSYINSSGHCVHRPVQAPSAPRRR